MIFTVTGKIRGKGRPRFANGHVHTDKQTRAYEALIAEEYRLSGGKLHAEPVTVRVAALFAIPKRATKKERELMLSDSIRPTKRPDIDNILKAVLDGLNGYAYKDDAQVVKVSGEKYYADNPEQLIIEVKPIDIQNTNICRAVAMP